MKKLSTMKPDYKKYRNPAFALLMLTLLFAGCYEFVFVNQPYTADPNSSFDVQVSAYVDGSDGTSGHPTVGVLLPIGWTLDDVANYANEDSTVMGEITYSESLSQNMIYIDPPSANYYWWVATDTNQKVGHGTYLLDLMFLTDEQTGTFFLDYMLGDGTALNEERSNAHLIIIGEINGCAPEGITFSAQEEIDNFTANYPGCENIAGDITIAGENITNLDGLNTITSIGGSLRVINNQQLTNLSGLNNLVSVGGLVVISDNEGLQSFSGLNSLTSIGREMLIEENPALQVLGGFESLSSFPSDLVIDNNSSLINIIGFENLKDIDGDLSINRNYALTSLSGLDNLTSIDGYLSIANNENITSLLGLENLNSIGGYLSVHFNNALTSLSGLDNLTSINGYLSIANNENITSFLGLENLNSIGGYLSVYSNVALTSLSGLDKLASIDGNLWIYDNPLLCDCEVEAICNYLSDPPGQIYFSNNGEGCSSMIEVAIACGTTIPCLEKGTINLYSQFDVDYFPVVFPGCTDILTSISIYGDDIVNLDSLGVINSISGSLGIGDYYFSNDSLTSLTGLANLTSVGGSVFIWYNDSLASLTGLENLSSIGGTLRISGNDALTTLNGMESLSTIGYLSISGNDALASLTGLDNITSITGNFSIDENTTLTSLTGLENLASIGGDLTIGSYLDGNDNLTSLTGLNDLTFIGGALSVLENISLTSLTGLENLTSIGGDLLIEKNGSLTSLSSLENVTSIGGDLSILYNDSLTSLTGLENVTSIGGELWIYSNPLLSKCEAEGICAYLSDPNGYIGIYDNAPGCSSIFEVAVACGTTIPCLEEGWISFYSQFDIDHFPAVFPGCNDLVCNVIINGDDISNLDSMGIITSIGGELALYSNDVLTSLSGLENLTSIDGHLSVENNENITSLLGLENLNSIGGNLSVISNVALKSLSGLDNLVSIDGNLSIYDNPLLCNCEVDAICNYFSDPPGHIYFSNNGKGCSSIIEVAGACGTILPCLEDGTYELNSQFDVDYFPLVYPGCNDILCNVSIGSSVSNLDSLYSINSIGGYLSIYRTDSLTTLSGLENLSSIGGYLSINQNNALTSLEGLENISASSISDLFISENHYLSTCEVQSICDYLAYPNGNTEFYYNAPGCNSEVEVQHACWEITFEDENVLQNQISFYPNPVTANAKLSGEFSSNRTINICIYNTTGLCIKSWEFAGQTGQQEFTLNLNDLPPGIYFLQLQVGNEVMTKKIVKL